MRQAAGKVLVGNVISVARANIPADMAKGDYVVPPPELDTRGGKR